MRSFIENIPKAELHVHIEGTLEPELLFEIAQKNKVSLPYKSVQELKNAYEFHNLQEFLDIYYQGAKVLITEEDFYSMTMAYLKKAHSQNVLHTEIFFDPQTHTTRGISFSTVINGIHKALKEGESSLGITSKLIMCFLRHLSPEEALETLEQAKEHLDKIDGVGLDSSENGNPPSLFEEAFHIAGEFGLEKVAHAGEEGPPEYVWEALDALHVSRIDHGNRALEDYRLIDHLEKIRMPLTVCPLSNLKLKVIQEMKKHPLKIMLERNLMATINSDDPAYFGGYINENYHTVSDALNLTIEDIFALAKNSFKASFISDELKEKYLKQVDHFYEAKINKTLN